MNDVSFYNPEGSVLRKAQLRMLEILDVFDEICRKHNIDYWLVCGTLLGARRHRGFIPWDDDLDVAVLQSDFKRVVSILKEELPENLKIQSRETDQKFPFYFAKIRDTNSLIYNEKRDFYKYKGIFIDIFPIEPVPSIKVKRIIDKFIYTEFNLITVKTLYARIKNTVLYWCLPIIHFGIRVLRFYSKYISNSKVYTFSYGTYYYNKFNMEYFFPVDEIMFEGKKYKAPSNVDGYLTDMYGSDFMDIPKSPQINRHGTRIEIY